MKTVLITAFEPYDRWGTNASWDALVALTSQLPEQPRIVTRRYPYLVYYSVDEGANEVIVVAIQHPAR